MMNKEYVSKIVEDVVGKNVETVSWNGEEVKINKLIDSYAVETIVSNVVDSCFNELDEYEPINKDFMFRVLVISTYTNIELPDDNAEKYAFVYGTDIFDTVVSIVSNTQLGIILSQIEDRLEFKKRVATDSLTRKIIELSYDIETIANSLGGIVGGVSADEIKKLIGAMSESKFDEGKLAKAIVSEQNQK